MTESNRTYRKSTRNTAIALVLGGAAILATGYLIVEVNSLDRKYGRIEENLGFYTSELQSKQRQLEQARERFRELSDRNQNLSEQVASAENSRESAEQRAADAQDRLEARQDELTRLRTAWPRLGRQLPRPSGSNARMHKHCHDGTISKARSRVSKMSCRASRNGERNWPLGGRRPKRPSKLSKKGATSSRASGHARTTSRGSSRAAAPCRATGAR